MKEVDWQYLLELAQTFDDAARVGLGRDAPEGARYIRISDTMAKMIAERLREIAGEEEP